MSSLVASEEPRIIRLGPGESHPENERTKCPCCGDPAGISDRDTAFQRARAIGGKYCFTCYMLKCYRYLNERGEPAPHCVERMKKRGETVDGGSDVG